jgi:subtilisin family serine protease
MSTKFFGREKNCWVWLFILAIAFYFLSVATIGAAETVESLSVSSEIIPPSNGRQNNRANRTKYSHLFSKAQSHGQVKVIVRFDVPFTPEPHLSEKHVSDQRSRISGSQEQLLTNLRFLGRTPHHRHNFKYTPHAALTVDADTLDTLIGVSGVENIQEDIPLPPILDLSVPRVGASQLQALGVTGTGISVAVLDTGVDKNHPFLQNSVVSEACYSTTISSSGIYSLCPGGVTASTAAGSAMPYGGNCPAGDCSHGTHVAGIIAGRSGVSGSPGPGMAPGANIIAIQVFTRFDSTAYCGSSAPCVMAYTSDLMKGLERVYALRNTYNIASVNMSLGGGLYSSNCDSNSLKSIIDSLRAVGIATVIASGNNGSCGSMSSPACISSAVSVGATDDSDRVASYSNSASFLSLLAPGSSIRSSVPIADGGGYQSWNGTSMATPHVAGAWALMKQNKPTATVTEILNTLSSTGLSITDSKCTSVTKKRINVYQAYQNVMPQVATPTFSQPAGTYIGSVTVSISCTTSGATIRYTTDGTDPTSSSTQYTGPLTLTTTTTLKARAFKTGMTDSEVASVIYTVIPKVATPTFSQPTGTYIGSVTVSISCTTSGATIRYTTNGFDPTSSSTQYTGPLILTTATTLKAKAFKTGMTDSDVASATYMVIPQVDTPTLSQPTGTYIASVTVSLSCMTSGATIRYTTDGSNPTSSSTVYSSALTFTTTTTLKAQAFKTGWADSDLTSATYTVIPTYQVTPSISFGNGHGTISPDSVQTVPQGSTVSFTVSADAGYTASVGGSCGGTFNGTVFTTRAITTNCTVIAGFTDTASCQDQPVRIVRTDTAYNTLQQAYDAAWDNDIIQAQALTLIQNLNVNRNISVTLSGGYPCNYSTNTDSLTTLKGGISTSAGGGVITLGNFLIKPNTQPPTVTAGTATNVTSGSATINGTVKPNSATTSYYFEWGTSTSYGTSNPLSPASVGQGTSDIAVTFNLTGLTPNTLYHYRLVAVNSEGITYGADGTFTTPCAFTVSPVTQIASYSSGSYSATVTANNGCNWTAIPNDNWITVNSGTNGTGNGTVTYTLSANPGRDDRSGSLTVAGQTLIVSQSGAPCSFSLSPASQSVGAWGGTGSVDVTGITGCTWTASSNDSWITISSGGSGTGNGSVGYSVNANSSASARSGTLTIAGQTFTVTQAAGPLTCAGLPVRIMNTGITYASVQDAYNAATNGQTIQVQCVTLTEKLTVDRNISLTLEGGYDCGFGYYTGINTILKGWIKTKAGGGTLTIKNFDLE